MAAGQASHVCRVAGGNDRAVEFEGGGYDERINSIGGGHAALRQEKAGALSNWPRKVQDRDAAVVQQAVDGGVEAGASANFAKNWSWHSNERAAFVRQHDDGACPILEDAALGRARQHVYRLGVED